jgi:hypothetical protein
MICLVMEACKQERAAWGGAAYMRATAKYSCWEREFELFT